MTDIILITLVVLSVPFIVLAVRATLARARALDERIEQYHKEQEDAKGKPGPINPYADMGEAFGEVQEEKREDVQ